MNLMEVMPGDDVETPIWDTYKEIIRKYDDRGDAAVGNIERFAFYDEAKTAYAIIATGEFGAVCGYHAPEGRSYHLIFFTTDSSKCQWMFCS